MMNAKIIRNKGIQRTALALFLVFSGSVMANDISASNFSQVEAKQVNFKNRVQLANWRPVFEGQSSGEYRARSFSGSSSGSWFSFNSRPSVPEQGPANPKGTIVVNPQTLSWAAYDSTGSLVNSGRASAGRDYCPDTGGVCRTPAGHFQIYAQKGADCVSNKYPLVTDGGAPMPYCMFFHGGYAIHGAYDVPDWNASHGCVRITPSAAQWLQNNFARVGTTVIVKSY